MATLLSYSEQQSIKPISSNNQDKYDQIAKEVEEMELNKLLGPAFLQAVQNTQGDYVDLLSGSEFEDCYGNEISHKGLKYVLAYLNYSKYLLDSQIADTYSGFRYQNTPESIPIPSGDIRRMQESARALALESWSLIKDYLDQNTDNYPLYNGKVRKVFRPRIYGIKKVNYGR